MWWLAAVFLLALIFYGLGKKNVCSQYLAAAGRAAGARNWNLFDKKMALARKSAARITDKKSSEEAMAEVEYMAAHGAYSRNRNEEAIAHLALAIQGFDHLADAAKGLKLSAAHQLWGDLAFDDSDFTVAEEHFRAAAVAVEFSEQPSRVLACLKRLGDALLAQRRYDDARAVIEKGIEFERRLLADTLQPEETEQSTVIAMAIPDLALARRDFANAERLYREKVEFYEQSGPSLSDADLTRYQFNLATAQRELGRVQDALLTLHAAVESAERDFGSEHPRTEHARRRLAEVYQLTEGRR
jgi:tetratricopeptide (TPR) repeat protein